MAVGCEHNTHPTPQNLKGKLLECFVTYFSINAGINCQSKNTGRQSGQDELVVVCFHVYIISAMYQVWQITQFFLFPFCKKSLICLEGKSMTTHRGNTILFRSSQQLPRLRLGPVKGFLS